MCKVVSLGLLALQTLKSMIASTRLYACVRVRVPACVYMPFGTALSVCVENTRPSVWKTSNALAHSAARGSTLTGRLWWTTIYNNVKLSRSSRCAAGPRFNMTHSAAGLVRRSFVLVRAVWGLIMVQLFFIRAQWDALWWLAALQSSVFCRSRADVCMCSVRSLHDPLQSPSTFKVWRCINLWQNFTPLINQARQLDCRDFKSEFVSMRLKKLPSGSFSAEQSIPGLFQEFC